jgi:hypothetical protein
MSAESVPRRNSRARRDVEGSHIRIRVPLVEAVAINDPDGVVEIADNGEAWARRIDIEGNGGRVGLCRGGGGRGGDLRSKGGRRTSWTCPGCRPGKTRRVAPGSVASATRPGGAKEVSVQPGNKREPLHTFRVIGGFVDTLAPDAVLAVAESKEKNPGAERDGETVSAGSEPPNIVAKLELSHCLFSLGVPDNDLVWGIERRGRSADEEDDVCAVKGENEAERAVGKL